ncbi:unnamed protein product [Pleuronectes platessa]|uniref:Uncharacterized protein n=1 Tax=Pleuronectes platessa TaxID=8262 RepID=A0A9N7VI15_PLEPL|nr:unnamed protein product [Pleuronectes platessa]
MLPSVLGSSWKSNALFGNQIMRRRCVADPANNFGLRASELTSPKIQPNTSMTRLRGSRMTTTLSATTTFKFTTARDLFFM